MPIVQVGNRLTRHRRSLDTEDGTDSRPGALLATCKGHKRENAKSGSGCALHGPCGESVTKGLKAPCPDGTGPERARDL